MKRSRFSTLATVALSASVVCGLLIPAAAGAAPETNEDGFLVNGVTAHRGFPEAYPENTFQGYEASIALGVDWIELDVFTTADDQLVVSHDETTGRFADRDLTIAESTYDELADLDVAHSFREEHGLTEEEVPRARMPLLSEILEMIMQQDKTRASLQPKDDSTQAAVEMIQEMGAQQWTGFNDGDLEKMSLVKELDPSIHVFWDLPASGNLDEELAIATDRGFESLVANQERITPEVIERIEAAGFESGAWTVNDSAVMKQFIDWGIDRLYTDSADQAMLLFGEDPREGLEQQLTGRWSMDETAGSKAEDTGSPNPLRDGRLQGNAAFTADGLINGAIQLHGGGDYVDVPFEVLPDTADHYTVSAWFKPENPGSGAQTILESSESGAVSIGLADETGNLQYSVATSDESVTAKTDIAPTAEAWHHVAVTYDAASGATAIHLNGQEVDSFVEDKTAASGQLAHTDGLHIGTNQTADGQFFEGQIDEVAVWNRVLSHDELANLWHEGGVEAPEQPAKPEETEEPSEPEGPEESAGPEEPTEPEEPADPEAPEESEEPEESDEPEDPEASDDPEDSDESSEGDIDVEADIEGLHSEDGEGTEPGSLVLSVAEGTAALGDQQQAGNRLQLSGAMPTVAVTDTRREANGWTVSGQSSNLTAGENTITADYLGWIPSVIDAEEGGPTSGTPVAGTLANGEGLATPQTLGQANADNRLGSTELTADLNLEIPVDTESGNYEGAMSVSLFPVD